MPTESRNIQVRWGPYFKPDVDDKVKAVALVQEALGGKGGAGERLITTEIAARKIAEVFDIEDVDGLLEALEKEKAEREAEAQQRADDDAKRNAEALSLMAANVDNGQNPAANRGGRGGNQAQATGGGGRGAAPTAPGQGSRPAGRGKPRGPGRRT